MNINGLPGDKHPDMISYCRLCHAKIGRNLCPQELHKDYWAKIGSSHMGRHKCDELNKAGTRLHQPMGLFAAAIYEATGLVDDS